MELRFTVPDGTEKSDAVTYFFKILLPVRCTQRYDEKSEVLCFFLLIRLKFQIQNSEFLRRISLF
ncbi:hypothetical protein B0E34_16505 [Chryseobacterium mucoviscidosis]|uniref:Uncharacterized protein n=2 Tax=Chryseobacterium TaxID=59732 RepID=A0A3D9AGW3_9FLAO|nr:hypothetical protein B0E34_16505 [Chryseobacterium mucoviscidosis]REC40252.1 hypothetical protein DRF68_20385 [Candidatus Chryseobacterium massiliae]